MSATNAEQARPTASPQRPFHIRLARSKDLSQIVSLLLASFYPQMQAHQWLYWLVRLSIQTDISARLKTPPSQYRCLVAVLHPPASESGTSLKGDLKTLSETRTGPSALGKVIGTAELSQRPCESWQIFPAKRAYLSNLAVSPTHRRQGAAQMLLRSCEGIALNWGFHQIYLHVMSDNLAAQALYTQAGYRFIEVSNPILSSLGLRPRRLLLSKPVCPTEHPAKAHP